MKRYMLVISFTLLILPSISWAQYATSTEGFNKNGTRVAQFLKVPIGARVHSMGDASSALIGDASALYWNPGGVGMLTGSEVHLTRVNYLLDLQLNFIGVVMPISNVGNLGFSLTSLTMDPEPVTTLDDPDGLSGAQWEASGLAVGATISRAITDRFSAGVTGKYIRESLYHSSAATVAFDLGGVYKTGLRGMVLGLAMTNFGGKMKLLGVGSGSIDVEPGLDGNILQTGNLETRSWHLPLLFRFGIAMDIIRREDMGLLIAADFNHPTDANERLNFGVEYAFQNRLFLRGGYKMGYDEENLTFGAGLVLPLGASGTSNFKVDYAYSTILGLAVHRFSFGFQL